MISLQILPETQTELVVFILILILLNHSIILSSHPGSQPVSNYYIMSGQADAYSQGHGAGCPAPVLTTLFHFWLLCT